MGNNRLCILFGLVMFIGSACTHKYASTGDDSTRDTSTPDGGTSADEDTEKDKGGDEEDIGTDAEATDNRERISCGDSTYSDRYTPGYIPNPEIESKVQDIVNSMTLAEKAEQMAGMPHKNGMNFNEIFRQPDNTVRNIRGFKFRDGPRGLNIVSFNATSTAFPVSMARGASFDLDLEYRVGKAIADETLAAGHSMVLAPCVNILRHPAWGRAQETYGEDPHLLGRLGSAFTVGIQQYLPACAKHFAGNNIENGRKSSNSEMDEQTLREIYGRAYEMIVQDGGVACIMAAYNLVNGAKSTENKHLLTDILRDDYGFKGFVLSDWWAMSNGASTSLLPGAYQSVAKEGVLAGLDIELPWSLNYSYIESITNNGQVSITDINKSVSRILQQKYRFNVGDLNGTVGLKSPSTTFNGKAIKDNEAHIELAYEAALKSMVLLKNEQNNLPIDRDAVDSIAVISANVSYDINIAAGSGGTINYATDVLTGDQGSSAVRIDANSSISPFKGIKEAAGSEIEVISGTSAADAKNADFVVVVAGLTPEDEGEEYTGAGDRSNFQLDGKKSSSAQNDLISAIAALGKPMAVVLVGGSVIDMPWLNDVPSVVMAWYPGMVGGKALGGLLFGDENFSGKLPVTWPKTWDDLPDFNPGSSVQMDYDLGYRYYDRNEIEPLFPFGHGQSYTSFEYSNLHVPCVDVTKKGVVKVTVDIKNTGVRKGDEVVFLFVSYPDSTSRRPIKELKGFYRVSLKAGKAKRVTIPLRISDIDYWDVDKSEWVVESGTVDIMVGPNAGDLSLSETMTVK